MSSFDFAAPDDAAFPGMDTGNVQAGLDVDVASLSSIGYDAGLCLTDFGETSEATVAAALDTKSYDCVLIGARVRTIGTNFLLFEKLITVVHQKAPHARICVNTGPDDSLAEVHRCI